MGRGAGDKGGEMPEQYEMFTTDSDEEKALAGRMKAVLMRSPEGRKAVEDLSALGYEVLFNPMDNTSGTRMFPDKKRVLLDPDKEPEKLAAALIGHAEKAVYQDTRPTQVELLSRLDVSLVPFGDKIDLCRERFDAILEKAYHRPGGKEILEQMLENNCQFSLGNMGDSEESGNFVSWANNIYLNDKCDDDMLADTLLIQSKRATAYANRETREVLRDAFSSWKEPEREDFSYLLEMAYKTPVGKEILDKVAKLGYSFAYEPLSDKTCGVCHPKDCQIVLNPSQPLERQVTTLIHECEHAIQFSLCPELQSSKLQAADFLSFNRAIEADACAWQSAFACQLENIWPNAYRAANNTPMMASYMNEMAASGNEEKAMKASFEAWYDFEHYQRSYEKTHKDDICNISDWAVTNGPSDCFTRSMPPEEILNVCLLNGKPYVTPEFLMSDEARAVSEETREEILQQTARAASGGKADRSVLELPTREDVNFKKDICRLSEVDFPHREALRRVVNEVFKMPDGRKVLDDFDKTAYYFGAPESGQAVEYVPEANTFMLDPEKSPKELAALLMTAVPEVKKQKENGAYHGLARIRPSLEISPKEEARRFNKIYEAAAVSPEVWDILKKTAEAGYRFTFDNIVPPHTVKENVFSRTFVLNTRTDNAELAVSLARNAREVIERQEHTRPSDSEMRCMLKDLQRDIQETPAPSFHSILKGTEKQMQKTAASHSIPPSRPSPETKQDPKRKEQLMDRIARMKRQKEQR